MNSSLAGNPERCIQLYLTIRNTKMHSTLVLLCLTIHVTVQAQTSSNRIEAVSIDKALNSQFKSAVYHLHECDSIEPLGNFKKVYK